MTLTLIDVAMSVLLLCSALCLFRIIRGPTAPDRTVAIDILGVLMVGFCCLFALRSPGLGYYLSIAIAWALVSFIGTIALAKYLEGRPYDD